MGTIVTRKTAKGEVRYRAQVRIERDGQKAVNKSMTFSRRSMAVEWIRRMEARFEAGLLAGPLGPPPVKLGELVGRYREEVGENFARSKNFDLRRLEGDAIAGLNVYDVGVQEFVEHARVRRDGGAGPATVNTDLVWFRLVYRYAKSVWGLPIDPLVVSEAASVLRSTRVIGRPNKRDRRPTYDELVALDTHWREFDLRSKYPMRQIMWFAIYSARREAELERIRVASLDRQTGTYEVIGLKSPKGNTGAAHVALLPALGWQVVDDLLKLNGDAEWLLPFNPRMISKYWTDACHLLGIANLRFHDLRHEGLSRLAEDGWTIPQIQQVSLHKSWGSLSIYVNMRPVRGQRLDYITL